MDYYQVLFVEIRVKIKDGDKNTCSDVYVERHEHNNDEDRSLWRKLCTLIVSNYIGNIGLEQTSIIDIHTNTYNIEFGWFHG